MPDNFFTTEYLFATTAPSNYLTFFILLGAYLLLVIMAILISLNKKMHKPLRSWFFNYFLTIGIVGIFVSFFRYQSISYIGTRFAMLLVIIGAVIWYFALIIYTLFKMPKEVKITKNEERYQKYLPKKKNK